VVKLFNKPKIKYKKRRKYHYNLHEQVIYKTGIKLKSDKEKGYLKLKKDGTLIIRVGYSWDGATNPAIDSKNFMRGSLVHDALYQLIREGILNPNQRERADKILYSICRQDGMNKIRAWWVLKGVRIGGKGAIKPDLLTAP